MRGGERSFEQEDERNVERWTWMKNSLPFPPFPQTYLHPTMPPSQHLLRRQLVQSIHIQRVRLVLGFERRARAIKDVIRGDMNKIKPKPCAFLR